MRSLMIATVLTASCAAPRHRPAPAEDPPAAVDVAIAHREPLAAFYRTSGTVRGRNTAVVASKTAGYVRAVKVRPGDLVKAGQSLVDLEANDVRASVARANAALAQSQEARTEADSALVAARAAAKLAKTSYERATSLRQSDAITTQQFDEAEARSQAASAQERMAEARVRTLGSQIAEARAGVGEASAQLGYAAIVAPFAGRVLERNVDPGALATPGAPLLVLSDEGALRVETAVDESHAGAVQLGAGVEVRVDTLPAPLAGTVGEIVPSVDLAARSFVVKIDLPDAGRLDPPLRPGAFARVDFRVGSVDTLVVPTPALTRFGALDRVFVVSQDRAHLRMVTCGEAQGSFTEILSGLEANEVIVAAPAASLRDGARVKVNP